MATTQLHLDPDSIAERLAFLYERRAVRHFRPGPVEDELIWALLDAAVHAPTANHQEPWRFVIVQDRECLRWISERVKALATSQAAAHGRVLKPRGAPGDGVGSPIAESDYNVFYNAEMLMLVCAHITNDFVVADCWLAAENVTLAAAALGLGSCVIGEAIDALNDDGVKHRLGIPQEVTVVAPIILGVAAAEVPPAPRKPPVVLSWFRS